MTSKERVNAAIARQQPDRVPMGLYAVDHDTIGAVIGRPTIIRNRCAFQTALWEGRRDEIVEQMKADVVDLWKALDCVDLLMFKEAPLLPPAGYVPEDPPRPVGDGIWEDRAGNAWQLEPESDSIRLIRGEHPPVDFDLTDPSRCELLDHLVAVFGEERYICGYTAGITALTLFGGMEQGLMTLIEEPERVHEHNRRQVAAQNAQDAVLIRPGVDGCMLEQDFGGTAAPLVSPTMFRDLCLPYLSARIAAVKERVPHVLFHSCGNTIPLMDMIVGAGIDVYESIQTTAKDMSIQALAEGWGDQICIWGAMPLEVLNQGTPEDARREVRANLEAGKAAPGYIFGPSHSIAFGTKYDNFMAMLDEFERGRDY